MIVRVLNSGTGLDEYCLLEFQGEILGDLTGELGSIMINGGTAEMDIGQHVLEGSVITLKLPFLVLEKYGAVCSHSSSSSSSSSISSPSPSSNTNTSTMEVCGVARKKVLFKTRPKPRNQQLANK